MSTDNSGMQDPGRGRKLIKRAAALIGALALVGGAALVWAHSPWRHHGEEEMAAHMEQKFRHVLEDAGVSAAQQDQVVEILKAAKHDMRALRDQHRSSHRLLHEILAAPSIDRNRLETLRADQIRLADEASKRIADAIADAAEVLTPEQRAAVAAEMEQRHRRWRGDKD